MATTERRASGWQLVEDGPEAYERYLARALRPWAERLVERAEVKAGERVLDLGCGTGIAARAAADRVGPSGRVTGLDLSEGMIEVARRVSAGRRPEIDFRVGDAAALPFPDASFDLVLSHQALAFIGDRGRAMREVQRVLAPGGRALLSVCRSLEHCPAYGPFADLLQAHLGGSAGAMMRSPFPSWSREEVREIVAGGGFTVVRVGIAVESLRYASAEDLLLQETSSSPLAGAVRELGPGERAVLVGELAAALEPFTDDHGLLLPMQTWVAEARA